MEAFYQNYTNTSTLLFSNGTTRWRAMPFTTFDLSTFAMKIFHLTSTLGRKRKFQIVIIYMNDSRHIASAIDSNSSSIVGPMRNLNIFQSLFLFIYIYAFVVKYVPLTHIIIGIVWFNSIIDSALKRCQQSGYKWVRSIFRFVSKQNTIPNIAQKIPNKYWFTHELNE